MKAQLEEEGIPNALPETERSKAVVAQSSASSVKSLYENAELTQLLSSSIWLPLPKPTLFLTYLHVPTQALIITCITDKS